MGRMGQIGGVFCSPLDIALNRAMNYLILTPDGVGSTILQRLITMTLYIENHNWIDQSNATYDFWNEEHIC